MGKKIISVAFLWAGLVAPGLAQLPVSQLSSVFPPGGQQGSTFEVRAAGQNLEDVVGLRFSHDGIKASLKGQGNPFEVTIDSMVPPGVYEARIQGRFGLSNPRLFAVGHLDEVLEAGSNRNPGQAQEFVLGSVVNGRADGNAVDHFKFQAQKGQRVLVKVQAELIDSRMNPVVALFNESGRELARNRQGQLLDKVIREDGVYFLRVHDFLYKGGEDYFYRLQVHAGPHIDFLFPPAGLPGETRTFRIYGRNLPQYELKVDREIPLHDEAGLEMVEVDITLPDKERFQGFPGMVSSVAPGGLAFKFYAWHGEKSQGPDQPINIGMATAPVVVEKEPNDEVSQAQKVELPCEVAGQFYPSRDRDWLQFEAEKGDVIWVEIVSQRLGLPTDPFLLLQRVIPQKEGEPKISDVKELYDDDTNLGGRTFNTKTRDALWKFEIKDTGLYRLLARDLFEYARSNPAHVYRLSLRRETPDFQLVAMPQDPQPIKKDSRILQPWPMFLRKGETWPIEVLAFRRDQFDAPIQLMVEGLPEGLRCEPVVMEKGRQSALLWVTAEEGVKPWAGSLRVVGKAKLGDHELIRKASSATMVWRVGDYNNEPVQSRESAALTASVSAFEPAALVIKPKEEKVWKASAGTKLEIPLQVERHWEFKEKFKLKAVGLAGLEKMKEFELDGSATNITLVIDLNEHKLSPGRHMVALRGVTKGKYRNQPEAVQMAKDLVAKADKEIADATEAVKQAKDALAKVEEKEKGEAQKTVTEAEASLKEAQEKQKQKTEAVKKAEEKAKPRDVTITVYSSPIHFEVMPAETPAEEPKKS